VTTTLYIGNLPHGACEAEVRELFSPYGPLHRVHLFEDRDTGRPCGFGLLEMETGDAQVAMEALDGFELGGHRLRVNDAADRGIGRVPAGW
jgi:RNA recognition motif-containing protein